VKVYPSGYVSEEPQGTGAIRRCRIGGEDVVYHIDVLDDDASYGGRTSPGGGVQDVVWIPREWADRVVARYAAAIAAVDEESQG
jgi:hypothetical protein